MSEWREWLADGVDLALSRLPIVVMTKKRQREELRNAFEIGVDSSRSSRREPPRTKATVTHLKVVQS